MILSDAISIYQFVGNWIIFNDHVVMLKVFLLNALFPCGMSTFLSWSLETCYCEEIGTILAHYYYKVLNKPQSYVHIRLGFVQNFVIEVLYILFCRAGGKAF